MILNFFSYENLQDFIAYRLLPHTSNIIFYWIKLRLISWYRKYERPYWYSTWRKLFRLLFSQGNELEHAKIGLFASQQYKSTKCTRKRKCVYQEYWDTSIWRKKDHKIYTNKILSNNFDILIKLVDALRNDHISHYILWSWVTYLHTTLVSINMLLVSHYCMVKFQHVIRYTFSVNLNWLPNTT